MTKFVFFQVAVYCLFICLDIFFSKRCLFSLMNLTAMFFFLLFSAFGASGVVSQARQSSGSSAPAIKSGCVAEPPLTLTGKGLGGGA